MTNAHCRCWMMACDTALACFYGFSCCDASLRHEGCCFSVVGLPKLASKHADTREATKGAAIESQQVFCWFWSKILRGHATGSRLQRLLIFQPLRGWELATLSCIFEAREREGKRCAIPRLASLGWGYLHLCRDAHDLSEAVFACMRREHWLALPSLGFISVEMLVTSEASLPA